jgi:hypothetical protein
MVRNIIAGAAVAGVLTLGTAGMAGAATSTTTGGSTSAATTATKCARAAKIEARIHKYDSAVATRLPKAEAREAKAKAAGHTRIADFIAKRITRVQNRETKLNALLAKIEAKCGTSGSTAG